MTRKLMLSATALTAAATAVRPRGILSVHADTTPTDILNQMRTAFEAFKQEHEQELADIKKGSQDVVRTEKVERINATIGELQAALDETNQRLAAVQTGGIGGAPNAAVREHAQAFNQWFRRGERAIDADLHDLEVKASLTTQRDPDGGYLVPEEMATKITRVATTVSAMHKLASQITISGDEYQKLVNQGGGGSGWVGEHDSRPETSTPTLSKLEFNLMEVYANPAATQRTLDDARIDIATWLANEVAISFAAQEGAAFINGTGVNQPRGILSYQNVANNSYAWGKIGFTKSGVAADLSDTNNNGADALIDLYHSLRVQYRNGASFVMSDVTAGQVRKFKDQYGQYLWGLPSTSADVPTILGKPVQMDDNMPTVAANALPIAFGNFKMGYLIIDKAGVRVLRDPFTNKPYVHFYTTKRVGGGVQNYEAIKLLKVAA